MGEASEIVLHFVRGLRSIHALSYVNANTMVRFPYSIGIVSINVRIVHLQNSSCQGLFYTQITTNGFSASSGMGYTSDDIRNLW